MIVTREITLKTQGDGDILDITQRCKNTLRNQVLRMELQPSLSTVRRPVSPQLNLSLG